MLSSDEVEKIAKLAHLQLKPEEVKSLASELSSILDYINQLKEIDIAGVEPLSHVHGSTNVMRADECKPSLPIDSLIKLTPDHSGRYIRVPIIVE